MSTHQNPDNGMPRWLLRTGLTLAAATAVACGTDDGGNTGPTEVDTYSASLQAFPSCDAFDDYMTDVFTDAWIDAYVYQSYGYAVGGGIGRGEAMDDMGAEPSNDSASGGGSGGDGAESPTDYTTTNVQEIGVDEPDLFKTDGDYMYIVRDQELLIVDSWPADEASLVGSAELPGWGEWMFLAGDRVVTVSYVYTGEYPDGGEGRPVNVGGIDDEGGTDGGGAEPMPTPDPAPEPDPGQKDALTDDPLYFQGLRVSIFDVTDRTAPTLVRSYDLEGDYVDARMVDGRIYLVTSGFGSVDDGSFDDVADALDALDPELDWDATDDERDAAAAALRPQVRDIIAGAMSRDFRSAFIPDLRVDGASRTDLFDCTSVMHPNTHAGVGMLSVVGFDPQTDETPSGVGLLANGWTVYGSATSLYVAQDSRWWSFGGDEPFAQTHIHRFALGEGTPAYAASGSVDGWLLDQFSMSEYAGYLRVATTDESNWWGGGVAVDVAVSDGGGSVGSGTAEPNTTGAEQPPEEVPSPDQKEITFVTDTDEEANNVFVLSQNGSALEVVGGVRGMAPGEDIFAVRFMGDLGYVVTFEQTDPLFVIDLANPESPQLRGELHIPGFSTYLHPFSDGYLIGVGRAGDDDGTVRGLSLRLFDVRDPSAPTMAHELEVAGTEAWSWSDAEHDHHAFTFHAGRNLLAIPVTLEDYSWDREEYQHFSGVIVYEVSAEAGFTEVGRISHSSLVRDRYCDPEVMPDDPEATDACGGWDYGWYAWMRRSAFVEDYLFALSDTALTASPISDLASPVSEVSLY